MRTIRLRNSLGEKFDVTNASVFLNEPSGFGFSRNDDYRSIGNRWVRVSKKTDQKSIDGKLIFATQSPYNSYREFMLFAQHEPLTMHYSPDGVEYQRRVILSTIEKSEISKDTHALECKVSFTPMTPWYLTVNVKIPPKNPDAIGMKFPTNWPVCWIMQSQSTTIHSDTVISSPCKLIIPGPATNPTWKHVVNGKDIETGKIKCELKDNERLIIDDSEYPFQIKIEDKNGNFIRDAYQDSDFSTSRFLNLEYGDNTISVSTDDGSMEFELEGYLYYETV